MSKKKNKKQGGLSYDLGIECMYTGDGSMDSFMANALLFPVDTFFSYEEWFAHRYGLNKRQKKGIKKLRKSLIKGHVKFALLFEDYDFKNFPEEAKKILARSFREIGFCDRDVELDWVSFLRGVES